ncbi:uncharacterized protein LOC127082536 [Lathyrus oleraceus]|uniref:uncharacterized protein LOC127082536 n=1 Tax=Pisum sativum TaxID=3888 RepID=UPI0021CFEE80|nr:uncharacterized protein LOC127082536 [Pisum sativum]
MAQNRLNLGFCQPNYTYPITELVLQTELPKGWKFPKFTKFVGDATDSTVEHIARYTTKVMDMTNNENLRLRYFPSSLTKNAFTWFTMLPPNSINDWNQLEKLLHKFRLLKANCFTHLPEHELVEMAAGGLFYSIRKKLDTQYLRDIAQLADRVRQVERLKVEKVRATRNKKEIVAFVDVNENDPMSDVECVEENYVNLAELKQGPPYVCKLIKLLNGKNPVETEKNDKFPKITYTFDVTKCDETFYLIVVDG